MTRLFSHRNRPVHLGSFPLERLSRRGSAMAEISVREGKAAWTRRLATAKSTW